MQYKNGALGLHEAQQHSQRPCLVHIVAVTSAVARVRRRNFALGGRDPAVLVWLEQLTARCLIGHASYPTTPRIISQQP